MDIQKKTAHYIQNVLGIEDVEICPVPRNWRNKVPFFLAELYDLYESTLFARQVYFVVPIGLDTFSTWQREKHIELLKHYLDGVIILLLENVEAYHRTRLIQKGLNFIVPGTQMFLPSLLLDLKETFPKRLLKKAKLTPSAQCILLYHILNKNDNVEDMSFKKIAHRFDYTQPTITHAVNSLKEQNLCVVKTSKEKFLHFNYQAKDLWKAALPFMRSPVKKKIYTHEQPAPNILRSNISALTKYSEINAGTLHYYAMDQHTFNRIYLQKKIAYHDVADGTYCMEIWSYNPLLLARLGTIQNVVDPLSLYLSMQDSPDERTQMALESMIERHIW